jgi:hypothetical protein
MFAFHPGGRPLAGWPVELPCGFDGRVIGRVIGDTLTVNERQYRGGNIWAVGPTGSLAGSFSIFDDTGTETTVGAGSRGVLLAPSPASQS